MSYKPYLIAPLKTGQQLDMEPWLLPQDAFTTLKNAYLRRGVLQKRGGHVPWLRLAHTAATEALGAAGSTNYAGSLANVPVQAGSVEISDTAETFTDDGAGVLTGDAGGSGTIDYTSGAYDVDFNVAAVAGVTAGYAFHAALAVMGIETFYKNSGASELLAFDTRRLNRYNATTGRLDDVAGADTWTGADNDFFWTEVWRDQMFITNNVDRIKIWNGTALSTPDLDIDGGGGNDIDTCLLCFAYKERLVLLRTTESGDHFPQRARWPLAADETDFTNDGYVDAPTLDWIIAADFIGDDLVVAFERSIWRLKYTGDATLPFRWEMIVGTEGFYATFASAAFSDEIIGLGPTALVACDNMDAYRIDEKMPDLVVDINPQKFDLAYAIVIEETGQLLLGYPSAVSDYSDGAVLLNYEENSWSRWDLAMHCYGYGSQETDLTLDDIDEVIDDCEWSFDERTLAAGYPLTLAGDRQGWIHQINSGGADNGADIALEIVSGRWAPFLPAGRKTVFGVLEILVTRDPDVSFTVDFMGDTVATAYKSVTVSCEHPSGRTAEKTWLRIPVGHEAEFHRIRIHHTASNQTLKIHALMPYFRAGGRIF